MISGSIQKRKQPEKNHKNRKREEGKRNREEEKREEDSG